MKKVLSENTELYDWVKTRVFSHIPLMQEHKMRDRFIMNYLAGYGNIAFGDENDRLMMPYRFSNTIRNILNRDGFVMGSSLTRGIQSSLLRLGFEVGEEEVLNFVDLNIGNARKRFNSLFIKATMDRPTFKYAEITPDPSISIRSRALNWNHQYTLTANDFYAKHLLDLEQKVIATGTGYTRIDYDISVEYDGAGVVPAELVDKFKFSYVPYYSVIDDGKYNSDTFYDLRNSRFVVQIHTWDKDTAIRNLSTFKKGVKDKLAGVGDMVNGLFYTNDLEDMGSFWNANYTEKYKTMTILEVFWKYYPDETSQDFDWYRSFMVLRGGGLEEIVTMPSDYAQGVPLIRKKHELQPDTIYGFTDIPNQISLDSVRNMTTSRFLIQAIKNSYTKRITSSRMGNLQDREGRRWTDYRDQTFENVRVGPGESVNNHFQSVQAPPTNTEALQMIMGLDGEQQSKYQMQELNPSRMGYRTLQYFHEIAQEIYRPMAIASGIYYKDLAEDLNTILQIEFTDEMWELRRKEMGPIAGGINLGNYFQDIPKTLGKLGIEVVMDSSTESALNQSLEKLMPFLQMGGMEVLYNEELIQLTGARKAGFKLPLDDQKKVIYYDIDQIMKGEKTEEQIPNMVLFVQTQEIDDATGDVVGQNRDYIIQNHELAVEVVTKYINDNKDVLQAGDQTLYSRLLVYLQLHREAINQQQEKQMEQMMMAQQMQQATAEGAVPQTGPVEEQREPGRPVEEADAPPTGMQ